jgi:hypothetical protein
MNGVFIGGAIVKIEGKNGQQRTIKHPARSTRFRMRQEGIEQGNDAYYLLYITNIN